MRVIIEKFTRMKNSVIYIIKKSVPDPWVAFRMIPLHWSNDRSHYYI